MKRCIVIGSMPVEIDLKDVITPDDFIYCADGGYLQAQKQGINPDIIVGDFDSSPQPENCTAKVIKLPVIKDDTDTYYIAREVIKEGFTHAVFCGVTGGRFDHTFANIQMLKFLAANGIKAEIVDKDTTLKAIKDGEIILQPKNDCYFSVFAMDEKCTGVSESGGFYEISDVELTNDFPIGVSNNFMGKPVKISVKKGTLLIVISRKD